MAKKSEWLDRDTLQQDTPPAWSGLCVMCSYESNTLMLVMVSVPSMIKAEIAWREYGSLSGDGSGEVILDIYI